ncbi:MAG: hypothetical protein ACYC7L_13800 [Nitrospirota bacterium]
MKTMRILRLIIPIVLFLLALLGAPPANAMEELEIINRPVNTSGLTGLLVTTSPFTLPPRTVEVGMSVLSETSLLPKYTSATYSLTVSYGLARNHETALKVPYQYVNEADVSKTRGMGDTELSYKWNVFPQPENRFRPGLAVTAAGVFPSGDRESGMNTITHWGVRVGLAAGSEIAWGDRIIGLYADAQTAVQDMSDNELRDSYALLNAGILFPISKYRNLQMLIEFNQRTGKDVATSDGVDYSAVTYGLRLVNERFNLSMGAQFVHKSEEGYNNSSRIMGMISVKI